MTACSLFFSSQTPREACQPSMSSHGSQGTNRPKSVHKQGRFICFARTGARLPGRQPGSGRVLRRAGSSVTPAPNRSAGCTMAQNDSRRRRASCGTIGPPTASARSLREGSECHDYVYERSSLSALATVMRRHQDFKPLASARSGEKPAVAAGVRRDPARRSGCL
jgi:hypothetical protein